MPSPASAIEQAIAKARAQITAGELDKAGWSIQKLLSRDANSPAVIALAALLEHRQGNTAKALHQLRQAVRRFPRSALLRAELAQALKVAGDSAGASVEARESLQIDPHNVDALDLLSRIFIERGQWEASGPLLEHLVEIAPQNSEFWSRLGCCAQSQGLLEKADQAMQKSMALDENYSFPGSNRALLSNYRDDLSAEEKFAIHRDWAARHAPARAELSPRASRKPGRLRIGYVSSDFCTHSVATFFERVMQHHDRSVVEVTCYASVPADDDVTRRLRSVAEHWRDISGLPEIAITELIRGDDIDILVDLAGHSPRNHLTVFAKKPAPIQVSWLGYPATTGLPQMNYRFTDSVADPPDARQRWHTEQLVRLPGTFFCYAGPGIDAEPGNSDPPSARRSDGAITFAVPTAVQKIRPAMIGAWTRVLNLIPNSRLVIQASGADALAVREWILREFAHAGLTDPARLDLHGAIGFEAYLRAHDNWDVVLDTAPFNGHTTTCHALWMGVPIVTLAGQMHAGRMGASVLHALNLDDCVAPNIEEYVTVAAQLAGDVERRRLLRRELRDRMRNSTMMDGRGFTRSLEQTFVKLARETLSE